MTRLQLQVLLQVQPMVVPDVVIGQGGMILTLFAYYIVRAQGSN